MPFSISSIIAHGLSATIDEKFHRLVDGVKNYPVMPNGLFSLFADPLNLRIPEAFIEIVIIRVKLILSHFYFLLFLSLNTDYHMGLTDTFTLFKLIDIFYPSKDD
jgi:hypothetical protein